MYKMIRRTVVGGTRGIYELLDNYSSSSYADTPVNASDARLSTDLGNPGEKPVFRRYPGKPGK